MPTKISQAFSLGNVATGATQVGRRTALNELNEVETFCVVANQYVKPHRFSCILILEKTNPLSIAGILSWNYRHWFFNKLTNEVPSIRRKCIFQTSWNNIFISWKCEWTSRIRLILLGHENLDAQQTSREKDAVSVIKSVSNLDASKMIHHSI